MNIVYSDDFHKQFYRLPNRIQKLYRVKEKNFRNDWRNSRLDIKKLKDHLFPFSFRINRQYRVLFIFVQENKVLFGAIGHRKDVYKRK